MIADFYRGYHDTTMLILAVDTSTETLSVAVCGDDAILAEMNILARRTHAERLVDAIDATMREANASIDDIHLLAVSEGPGSFTGLRIGVSTMKGLAAGAGKPLIGVPTLDALARQAMIAEGTYAPLLDARMDEVYGAVYRFAHGLRDTVVPPCVGPVEALLETIGEDVIVFGEGARRYRERIEGACPAARFAPCLFDAPRAAAVAQEALALHADGAATDATLVRPVYLRKSQPEAQRAAAVREASGA